MATQLVFMFTPKIGGRWTHFYLRIFFNWVGKTHPLVTFFKLWTLLASWLVRQDVEQWKLHRLPWSVSGFQIEPLYVYIYRYIYICTHIMYLNDWSRMPEHLQIAFVWIFDRHAWTVVAKCCLNRATSHERSGILAVSIDGQIQEKKTCSREVRFQMHWKFIIRAPLTKRQVRTRFQTQLSKDCPMIHGVIWQNQL